MTGKELARVALALTAAVLAVGVLALLVAVAFAPRQPGEEGLTPEERAALVERVHRLEASQAARRDAGR